MKRVLRPAAGLVLWFALSGILTAQVPSRPEIVGMGEIRDLDTVLIKLSRYYFEGRWDLLQHEIDNLGLEKTPGGHQVDPKKNYYLIVFLSREEGGEPRLIRAAWHKPAPYPYAARIPGRKEIFEIVLGAGSDLELKTSYISAERENPLLSEIPRFVKKVEPVLAEWIRKPNVKAVNFHVRRIVLPFARAKIKIADMAVLSETGMVKAAGAKEVKASFDFENVPPERFSFGLISAAMLGKSYADERVRLTDDGYYAADPPKNPLAAAILNIHPVKYDPESAKMEPAERFRLFTGLVLNPDMGVCAGAGFALLRGLSINAGGAVMGIPVANKPRALVVSGREKTLPENPKDPFKTKWRTVGFIGFGYNF